MAATADSSSNTHSPRSPGYSGDGLGSPQFRRKNFPSPWAQVVRGDPDSIPAVPHSPSSSPSPAPFAPEQIHTSDRSTSKASSPSPPPPPSVDNSGPESPTDSSDSPNSNVARPKKPAWNKPSNGVVEVSPVMGAVSWPALSESTRAHPKSSSDSSKNILDASVSVSQGPVIQHSPQKQAATNANPSSTPNHTAPVRQQSMKRGGSGSGVLPLQSSFAHPPPPPPPPPFPLFELPQNSYGKPIPVMPDMSPREQPPYRSHNWESRVVGGFGSHTHVGNDHPVQRNTSRRGNFGSHHRGDGSHYNSYGSRRDQDRGNYEWNSTRSSAVRDAHMQPQRATPRGFMRPPPPNAAPFIGPPPVRPFGSPMGITEITSPVYIMPTLPPEPYRGYPFIPSHAPPPTMIFPVADPPLRTLLVNQIDYYFSDANLIRDEFLKSNMDDQGWVPITLIAGFPRVQNLTKNIQLILDSLRNSTVVEVQGDKVRRRNEWMKWISSSGRFSTDSGSLSPGGSSYNMLTTFQKISVEEVTTYQDGTSKLEPQTGPIAGNCSPEELTGQAVVSNGEDTHQDECPSQN